MRRILLAIVFSLIGSPFAAQAQNATPVSSNPVLAPDALVDGLTLAEWQGRYFQWVVSLFSSDMDPYLDTTGDRCANGQHGPVFFLAPGPAGSIERSCNVPTGVTLFVPILSAECSSLEPPPYGGSTEEELRRCAASHIDTGLEIDLTLMSLSVDGQAVNLTGYRTSTPMVQVVWSPGNDAGVPAGVAQSVGDGYAVLVGPLSEGEHIIELGAPDGAGGVANITYTLTVSTGL